MDKDSELSRLLKKLQDIEARHQRQALEIKQIQDQIRRLLGATDEKPDLPEEKPAKPKIKKIDWESFIGENIINKVGIIVLLIGFGIFINYALETDFFTPLLRIVSGYLSSIVLLFLSYRLRNNYLKYSALLFGGAVALAYFTTFSAHGFYQLFNFEWSIIILILITIYIIVESIRYDSEWVAILGLVGGYGIPFILDFDLEAFQSRFWYITIINLGILTLALRKYWKKLIYLAFSFTWLIFMVWLYQMPANKSLLIEASVIYFIFFGAIIGFKLIQRETYRWGNVLFILLNSFLFFAYGYYILSEIGMESYQGTLAFLISISHFAFFYILYRRQQTDVKLTRFLAGLGLIFIAIAIVVQLDGNWVTILWGMEALVLMWVARKYQAYIYERLSRLLALLSFLSLLEDWLIYQMSINESANQLSFLWNWQFFSSVIMAGVFVTLLIFQSNIHYTADQLNQRREKANKFFRITLMVLGFIIIYGGLGLEIWNYFNQQISKMEIYDRQKLLYTNLYHYRSIAIAIYSLGILWIISYFNYKVRIPKTAVLLLNLVGMGLILSLVVSPFEYLQINYLNDLDRGFGLFNILSRYIFYGFYFLIVFQNYKICKADDISFKLKYVNTILLNIYILILLTLEFNLLFDWFGWEQASEILTSVVWSLYATIIIILGIRWNDKVNRWFSLVLFGVTLFKFILFDVTNMSVFGKILIFLIIGSLLLLTSFFYQKKDQNTASF